MHLIFTNFLVRPTLSLRYLLTLFVAGKPSTSNGYDTKSSGVALSLLIPLLVMSAGCTDGKPDSASGAGTESSAEQPATDSSELDEEAANEVVLPTEDDTNTNGTDNLPPDSGAEDNESVENEPDAQTPDTDSTVEPDQNPPLNGSGNVLGANNGGSAPLPATTPAPQQPVFPFAGIPDNAPQLPATVSIPDGVNPDVNRAPYFESLSDQQVLAGQFMELRLVPRDPDGNVPGLFTGPLPDGAQYIDNFDGTKTIRWRPLEPDVGVLEIMVTAVDAEEPLYRTSRTVRIRVRLPDDLSTIVNLPPSINEVRPHTARAGDEVVILVKAQDPNGHTPYLDFLNPPAEFSFETLEEDERIKVLRWQTRDSDIGIHYLNFKATDRFDANLTAEKTIEIELRGPSDFVRPGSRLRDLAQARGLHIGYASLLAWYNRPDGVLYSDIAGEEFNIMTTENSVKWGVVNPEPNRWEWEAYDRDVQHAYKFGMLVHGHPLVWHRQLPQWIQNLPVDNREEVMLDFIGHLAGRYSDAIAVWDVVNEALNDDGSFRDSVWFKAMGEGYIEKAFRQARISAPNSQLLYNDYDVAWEGAKADAMYQLLQSQLEAGVPINGAGFQMHINADFDRFESVKRNFQRFAELGLDIYITELDVAIRNGESAERQAEVYSRVLSLCLEMPACKAYQTWGFTDRYTWLRGFSPLIFDDVYNPKPAYFSIQQRLQE